MIYIKTLYMKTTSDKQNGTSIPVRYYGLRAFETEEAARRALKDAIRHAGWDTEIEVLELEDTPK